MEKNIHKFKVICSYFQIGSKILISTGSTPSEDGKTSEVISLGDHSFDYTIIGDFPKVIKNAVGANLNFTPVICGGQYDDEHGNPLVYFTWHKQINKNRIYKLMDSCGQNLN